MIHSLCCLLTVAATALLLMGAPASLASAPVYLLLEPQTLTVTPDADFTLSVMVDSGQQQLDGVQLTLGFEPSYLTVVSLTPGTTMGDIFQQGYSNEQGLVTYAAGKMFGTPPSGRFELVRVRCKALTATTGTAVQFLLDGPLATRAVFGGENLPVTLTGSVVVISQAAANPSPTTAGAQPTATDTVSAAQTPTATQESYPAPVTGTPVATATSVATATPVATETAGTEATITSTGTPSYTKQQPPLPSPAPSATPSPTPTPLLLPTVIAPSATPTVAATATPAATDVPPAPTATPVPPDKAGDTGTRILAILGILIIAILALGFAYARRHWLSS